MPSELFVIALVFLFRALTVIIITLFGIVCLFLILPVIEFFIDACKDFSCSRIHFSLWYSNYKEDIQGKKFRIYVDVINIVILFFALILNIPAYYILFYLPLYLLTRIFISIVRSLIIKSKKHRITEFWFFVYLVSFAVMMFAYVVAFSLFYNSNFSLGFGSFETSEGRQIFMTGTESLIYSSYTFFSMNYMDVLPRGIFRIFTIIEVFISQMLVITFIGIFAGNLIASLKLKRELSWKK